MIVDGDPVSVYQNASIFTFEFLVPREEVIAAIHRSKCVISGGEAKRLGYGLCLYLPGSHTFIQCKPDVDYQAIATAFAEQN
jgi:hypothetical protein